MHDYYLLGSGWVAARSGNRCWSGSAHIAWLGNCRRFGPCRDCNSLCNANRLSVAWALYQTQNRRRASLGTRTYQRIEQRKNYQAGGRRLKAIFCRWQLIGAQTKERSIAWTALFMATVINYFSSHPRLYSSMRLRVFW